MATIRELLDAYVAEFAMVVAGIEGATTLGRVIVWISDEVKPELGDELLDFRWEGDGAATVRMLLDSYTADHAFVCETPYGVITTDVLKGQLGDRLLDFMPGTGVHDDWRD